MVETPTAIFDVRAIAAHPRVSVLVIGHQRPRQGAPRPADPGPRQPHAATWRPPCSRPARPARSILDGVYNDVRDAEGFAAECRQGVEMGFDGKTLVHPSQVGRPTPPGRRDRRRGRRRPPRGHRRLPARPRPRAGRRHGRRPDDRAPPRRQRPPHAGHRRRHRPPRPPELSGHSASQTAIWSPTMSRYRERG